MSIDKLQVLRARNVPTKIKVNTSFVDSVRFNHTVLISKYPEAV